MSTIRQTLTDTILDDITDLERAKALAAKYLATLEYKQLAACITDAGLGLPENASEQYRAENILVGIVIDFQGADYAEYDTSLNRIVDQREPTHEEERTLPELYTLMPQDPATAALIAENNDREATEHDDNAPF